MTADSRPPIRPPICPPICSSILAASLAAVLLAGCQHANPAVQRSEQATSVLINTRQSLSASELSVADSQTALRTLGASKGDLRPPFDAFLTQLKAVRKQAARQQQQGETVLTQATAYVAARQHDISTISNDELRHAAELRTASMQSQTQTIKDLYAKMNAAFSVYLRNLDDLQTYLANDLNYGALNPAQRWVDASAASGEQLRGDLRNLAVQIDLMSNTLSPAPIASSPWPATQRVTTRPAGQP